MSDQVAAAGGTGGCQERDFRSVPCTPSVWCPVEKARRPLAVSVRSSLKSSGLLRPVWTSQHRRGRSEGLGGCPQRKGCLCRSLSGPRTYRGHSAARGPTYKETDSGRRACPVVLGVTRTDEQGSRAWRGKACCLCGVGSASTEEVGVGAGASMRRGDEHVIP